MSDQQRAQRLLDTASRCLTFMERDMVWEIAQGACPDRLTIAIGGKFSLARVDFEAVCVRLSEYLA